MNSESQEAIERVRAILRAQGTPEVFDDLVAHMNAVEFGHDILPAIREVVLDHDWSTAMPRGKVGALTALMLAAQDVDESGARQISAELSAGQTCHPVFLARLASINSLAAEDFEPFETGGLRLFVAKGLESAEKVATSVEGWLSHVPSCDLDSISRIYIVEQAERSYWGQYLRVLSKITLVWQGWNSPTLRQRLGTEVILYHEIGHHVHRHRRGSSEEHEDMADQYALERFGSAHPFLGRGPIGAFTAAYTAGLGKRPRESG